nr:hypothetical protein Iba_chr14aCG12280 [Ipomoea batatas]GMD87575.1 hypothetical protein Iba_chr14bCG17090 [Ipomoea batatas]
MDTGGAVILGVGAFFIVAFILLCRLTERKRLSVVARDNEEEATHSRGGVKVDAGAVVEATVNCFCSSD